jgi:hypothetical protein
MSGVVRGSVGGRRGGFQGVVGECVLVSGLLLCGVCFMIRLNMGLYMSVYVSFIGNFCALRLSM